MSRPSSIVARLRWPMFIAAVVAAFLIGLQVRPPGGPDAPQPTPIAQQADETSAKTAFWTCSMHPQIRLPEPGQCPICAMDLVPVSVDQPSPGEERQLVFSEAARKLAEIRTVAVERRPATVEVRMVGKVDYDETRISDITSYIPGRLERMFVDYTGVTVNRGDHMVDIYSPELIAAQEELLQAIRAQHNLERSELEIMRRTAAQTVTAARDRLRLWGLLEEQISDIEQRGSATELITIYSTMTGVVIKKYANQGTYVDTGSPLYTIADLNHLWVRLEAYESDMEWLHLGQEVEFATEAYPGIVFKGRVSFIDPVVDPRTRTVKLRVNVNNEDQRLKPEMLVRAVVHAQIAGAGRVFDPYLAGKWIGPMHPEIVREEPGSCDICGMPLVPAESLGFVRSADAEAVPLVIPVTAPLITGKRAVVYVEVPGTDRPTYEGREVELGPKAGDLYVVRAGLSEGERVVVEGNFKIDSALQIQAKPSMMSPGGTAPASFHDHDAESGGHITNELSGSRAAESTVVRYRSAASLTSVYESYLDLRRALAAGDLDRARSAFRRVDELLGQSDTSPAAGADRTWDRLRRDLLAATAAGNEADELSSIRAAFRDLSEGMIEVAERYGHTLTGRLVVTNCPMAFEGGGRWLQEQAPVGNPYFGESMLGCGEVTATLEPRSARE